MPGFVIGNGRGWYIKNVLQFVEFFGLIAESIV